MESIITVTGLSFSYGKKTVLEKINLELRRGCAAALVGDNGSGKSTLLALLAKIIKPCQGEIKVSGSVAYLPQEIALVEDLSFNDNLRYFASLAGVKVPQSLPFDADKMRKMKIKNMSGGMKKLCSICCTLLCEADIYMFDEPCASLDREHRQMLSDYIKELVKNGKTVLYVGHDESEYNVFADTLIVVQGTEVKVKELSEAAR